MTAALIVEAGGKALFVKTNVTVAAEVDTLLDKAVAHYGRIDCAVNGAAIEEESMPLAEGEDAWREPSRRLLPGYQAEQRAEVNATDASVPVLAARVPEPSSSS